MARTRLPGSDRRSQLIPAARRIFSQHVYDGAKTLQIARYAKIPEALAYRHFPIKPAPRADLLEKHSTSCSRDVHLTCGYHDRSHRRSATAARPYVIQGHEPVR